MIFQLIDVVETIVIKKVFMLFLISVILSPSFFGQEIEVVWDRTYDGDPGNPCWMCYPYALLNSDDGGYIIAYGVTYRARILKVDSRGEIVWDYWTERGQFSSDFTDSNLMKCQEDGFIFQTIQYSEQGDPLLLLIRLSSNGEELWSRTYDFDFRFDPRYSVHGENDIIIVAGAGYFNRTNRKNVTIALDNEGNVVGIHTYNDAFGIRNGCYFRDNIFFFTCFANREFIETRSFLLHVDSEGDSVDISPFELGYDYTLNHLIKPRFDRDIIIGGSVQSNPEDQQHHDVFLASLSNQNEILNMEVFGEEEELSENMRDVIIFPRGEVAFCGWTNRDYWGTAWFQLTDEDFNDIGSIYDTGIGIAEYNKMTLGSDNDIVILGYTASFLDSTDYQITLTKLSVPVRVKELGDKTPNSFSISSAFPNPFNSTINIAFDVGLNQNFSVGIYDVYGRYVTGWEPPFPSQGEQIIVWDTAPDKIPSGVYNVIVTGVDQFDSIQLVKIK